jgi:predicted DNA-binding transcriptional regulator AlpA
MRSRREISEPRRGLTRAEAARFVGFSPKLFDQMVEDGRMPRPVKQDGEEIFDLIQLDLAFDRISGGASEATSWVRVK